MRKDSKPTRLRKYLAWSLAPILAFLAFAAWAYSSPVGSSPDDDYHLASIWCGLGEREGMCEPAGADSRAVPHDLVVDSVCYAFDPTASAACQFPPASTALTETERGNFDESYPPVYYATMAIFASENHEVSVLTMRLVNTALFLLLVTSLFILLPLRLRPALAISFVVTMVPLGMFIVPSTNPSSWAMISAGIVWAALLGFFETSGPRKIALGLLATLGAIIGAGARADSAVYVGIAVVAVLILVFRAERRFWFALALPVVMIAIALVFFFSSGQSEAAVDGLDNYEQPISGFALAITNFLNVPSLWAGFLGQWGLGWNDTSLPAVVWVLGLGSIAAVSFYGLSARGNRKYVAVGFLAACLWLIPTMLLTQSGAVVGEGVQPRYILPIAIILIGLTYIRAGNFEIVPTRAQLVAVVLAVSAANSVALYFNIKRYVSGTDGGMNLNTAIEWWWSSVPSPMVVWGFGSICFTACIALLAFHFYLSGRGETSIQKAPAAEMESLDRRQWS